MWDACSVLRVYIWNVNKRKRLVCCIRRLDKKRIIEKSTHSNTMHLVSFVYVSLRHLMIYKYLLSIWHRKMFHSSFKPIASCVAWWAITSTFSIILKDFFEGSWTVTIQYCSSFKQSWARLHVGDMLRFIYTMTFRVIDECMSFYRWTIRAQKVNLRM